MARHGLAELCAEAESPEAQPGFLFSGVHRNINMNLFIIALHGPLSGHPDRRQF